MKRSFLPLAFLLLLFLNCFSQGEIPVSMYTGSPGISIPLYTLVDHDLQEPLSLVYNVSDVNLSGSHTYGVGWDLSSGNQQVSREVRGLPDDISVTARMGWLYNNNFSVINSFPNSSDLSVVTCTDEQADQAFINNLVYYADTEPDLFSFSVGNYSGHFIFNNSGAISLIPYQDIQIVPTFASAPTDMTIIGWTITTNSGIVYKLNESCSNATSIDKVDDKVSESMLSLFEHDFRAYSKVISYSYTWKLSKMSSPTGAYIDYTYSTKIPTTNIPFVQEARIFDATWDVAGGGKITKTEFPIMQQYDKRTTKTLSQVKTSSGMWAICDPLVGIKIYEPLRSPTVSFKDFSFTYNIGFLMKVTESYPGSTCSPIYKLDYVNKEDYPSGVYEGTPTMPFASMDFWGYFNRAYNVQNPATGPAPTYFPTIYVYPNESASERYRLYPIPSYSGTQIILKGDADRLPNEGAITTGTLSRVIYPSGGEADIIFEANKYYDAKAGKDQIGGGLRVKQITYFDGINPAANIVKNFTYTDAIGHSSGKLISRPAFAVPVWQYIAPTWTNAIAPVGTYTAITKDFSTYTDVTSKWRGLTAVTNFDISSQNYTQGSSVGYTRVTVTRPGNGKAVFEYAVPATYGDGATGASPTDWSPTMMKFARPSTCSPMNIITQGEVDGYAAFPNTFYDYERGLLLKKSEYNNAGTLVRLTQDSYKYIFKNTQPTSVTGLAYELFPNATNATFLYGRYVQIADVAKVLDTETVTTYDENNTARNLKESTKYNYSTGYHRLLSRIDKTTADGSIYSTSFKYVLDYPVTATVPTDITLKMIKYLKDAYRYGTIIEQISSMTPAGGNEVTIGASLIKFDPFLPIDKALIKYQLVFRPLTPVSDFVPSGVNGSYTFTNDSRYETVSTVNEYTTFDIPLSTTGEDRNSSGALWGYNSRVPVTQFTNAQTSNIAFSDFETTTNASFTLTNIYYGAGRTDDKAIHPYATLTRKINKAANATKYLLSFWLKNTPNTTLFLTVTLKDAASVVLSTANSSYQITGSDYQYFTKLIDVSALPSTFIIEVKGKALAQPPADSDGPNLLPMIDDVGFYPDFTGLSTFSYDMPFGVKASTDPSGMTSYKTYDGLGRMTQILDQNHNIREAYSYTLSSQISPPLAASFSTKNPYYVNTNIQLTADINQCISGVMYSWDFGDGNGFTTPSSSNVSPVKSYTAAAKYSVTLRETSAGYPTSTITKEIDVRLLPLGVNICATGVQTFSTSTTTGNGVTSSYNCFTASLPDTNWVTFKVLSTTNTYTSTLTYQWKKRPSGTLTWVESTGGDTLPPQKVDIHTVSFDIMCTATSSDGRTADSNIMTVTVTN